MRTVFYSCYASTNGGGLCYYGCGRPLIVMVTRGQAAADGQRGNIGTGGACGDRTAGGRPGPGWTGAWNEMDWGWNGLDWDLERTGLGSGTDRAGSGTDWTRTALESRTGYTAKLRCKTVWREREWSVGRSGVEWTGVECRTVWSGLY